MMLTNATRILLLAKLPPTLRKEARSRDRHLSTLNAAHRLFVSVNETGLPFKVLYSTYPPFHATKGSPGRPPSRGRYICHHHYHV